MYNIFVLLLTNCTPSPSIFPSHNPTNPHFPQPTSINQSHCLLLQTNGEAPTKANKPPVGGVAMFGGLDPESAKDRRKKVVSWAADVRDSESDSDDYCEVPDLNTQNYRR